MSIFTSHLSASNGAQLTGSVRLTEEAAKAASLNFVKGSTNITAGDNLGSVIFSGRDGGPSIPGQDFIIGAAIAATASANWVSNYQQATDLQFWVQSGMSGDNRFSEYAFLTLSGTNGTAEFTGDVKTGRNIISPIGAQIGQSVGAAGPHAPNAGSGYSTRVSSNAGDAGVEIDAKNSSAVSSVVFNHGGQAISPANAQPGIFVSPTSPAFFSIHKTGVAQEKGALMINGSMNSVRIGGGEFGTDAYDGQASLVVSASADNRNSWVMIRSRHDDATANNTPVLTFDMKSSVGGVNSGGWHAGVSSGGTKPFRITGNSIGSSMLLDRVAAMTFREAGTSTSIGVGGNSSGTWPATNLPRSMDPTGSFHIEHTNATPDQLASNLTKANLLLGNSATGGSTVYSQLAFDISTAFTPNKHTANITVSKKQSTDAGHMSFRMYDESGNDNSTRPRVRIDGQGGIIMLSGSTPAAGAGWPVVNNSNYLVGTKMPSGSLTLVANKPGGLWNPPTLNLVTWGSNSHSSPTIIPEDSLGRIQWWSSDSGLVNEDERVSAYIDAVATDYHDSTNKSPADLKIYTRGSTETSPGLRLKISSESSEFTGDVIAPAARLDHVKNQAGADVISTDPSTQDTEFHGSISVATTIKDGGGSVKIDPNGADVDLYDNLKVLQNAGRITIGQGAPYDQKLVFNSDAQDYVIGTDNSRTELQINLGTNVGTPTAGITAAIIDNNARFAANSYQTISWGNSLTNAEAIDGDTKAFRCGLLGTAGKAVMITGAGLLDESIEDMFSQVWVAPCDGSFSALSIIAKFRFYGDAGGDNSSNAELLTLRMHKQAWNKDADDVSPVPKGWVSGGTPIHMRSIDYISSYAGFFGGQSTAAGHAGETFMTKRCGDMGSTASASDDFGVVPQSTYNITDGTDNIDGDWVFSKGDKIVLTLRFEPYGSPGKCFFSENTNGWVTGTNYINIETTVRLNWPQY